MEKSHFQKHHTLKVLKGGSTGWGLFSSDIHFFRKLRLPLAIINPLNKVDASLALNLTLLNPNSEGVPATHLSEGGAPPLVNAVLMAQTS